MPDIPDELRCLFSATVEERDGAYVLEVPIREVETGDVRPGSVYRVALFESGAAADDAPAERPAAVRAAGGQPAGRADHPEPPVSVGEERTVEIEDIGDQGDGIARVERGYVVIVPDTEEGERVTIRITDVNENVGFGEVLSRHDFYE